MKLSKRPFHHSISIYDLVYRSLLIRGGGRDGGSKFPAFLSKTKGQKVHARSKIIFRLTRSNGGGMGVWGKD